MMQLILLFLIFISPNPQIQKDTTRLKPFKIEGEKYWFGGFNEVYQTKEGSLVRIDNSLNTRFTISPYTFQINDTVVKYGGYGFWSQRNFLIYFDLSTLEWEYYKSKETDFITGSFSGLHNIQDKRIIFFGGLNVNPQNRLVHVPSTQVVEYNFTTKELRKIGQLDFDIRSKSVFYNSDDFSLVYDEDFIYNLDPFNNKVEKFHKPKSISLFVKADYNKKEGTFIITRGDVRQNHLKKINLDDSFLRTPIETYSLFKTQRNYFLIIPLSLFLTLIIFLIILRKKTEIILTNQQILFKRKKYQLDEKDFLFLKDLLIKKTTPFNKALEIYNNPELSYGHNTRITNEKIERLSIKLKAIFKLKNKVIIKTRSKLDRRLKNIILSDEFVKLKIKIK